MLPELRPSAKVQKELADAGRRDGGVGRRRRLAGAADAAAQFQPHLSATATTTKTNLSAGFFSLHFRDDFKFRTAMNVTSAFLLFLFFFYKKRYREGY